MDTGLVRDYFNSDAAVAYYLEASQELGLWASEERFLAVFFSRMIPLLELGCGAGRIAIGLYELGYKNVLATDYAKKMVQAGRHLARKLEYRIAFRLADAQSLEFEDNIFDGAIFGFNGWTQIPGAENRQRALHEIYRVLRPGAYFVFTTHDRDRSPHQSFWRQESERWARGAQDPHLFELGRSFGAAGDRCTLYACAHLSIGRAVNCKQWAFYWRPALCDQNWDKKVLRLKTIQMTAVSGWYKTRCPGYTIKHTMNLF